MEWISQHLFATISGWDLLVWASAYGIWRYLTADPALSTCDSDSSRPAVAARPLEPRRAESGVAGLSRWQRRDILLQKQRESLAYRHQQRRKVQRAA